MEQISSEGPSVKAPAYRDLVAPAVLAALAFSIYNLPPLLAPHLALSPESSGIRALRYLCGSAAWLAAAWLGARFLDIILRRAAQSSRRSVHYPRLLGDLLRGVFFALALVAILVFVFDQPTTGLIATSSVLIAVIGFALRNIISDVFSGIALNFDHPYKIGDWVETTPGMVGRVVEITWRATRLATRDGTAVIVPNGVIAGGRLVNYSSPDPAFRATLRVPLDSAVPAERAKRIIAAGVLGATRAFPDLKPEIYIQEYNDSGVVYAVRYWIPDYGQENACRDAVAASVHRALHRAGLTLAHPKRDITVARRRDREIWHEAPPEALLAQIEIFEPFTVQERQALAAELVRHVFNKGDVVVRQGDLGASLFIVAEGALSVTVAGARGGDIDLDQMMPGDVFGEISLLTGQPRSASVVAATEAVIYELCKEHLDPVLRHRPEIAECLAAIMAERQYLNAERMRIRQQAPEPMLASTTEDILSRLRRFFGLIASR